MNQKYEMVKSQISSPLSVGKMGKNQDPSFGQGSFSLFGDDYYGLQMIFQEI